jgi:prolyl-tRNA synthetase
LTPGFKFHDWEMRGVPLRVEIGPKDVANGTVALARRDQPGKQGKQVVPQAGLDQAVTQQLDQIQAALHQRAADFRLANTHQPRDYAEFRAIVESGWADAWWCGEAACEAKIKEDTKATVRCIPLDQPGGEGRCIQCGSPAKERALFARAY